MAKMGKEFFSVWKKSMSAIKIAVKLLTFLKKCTAKN
jgi:hypothetical protein